MLHLDPPSMLPALSAPLAIDPVSDSPVSQSPSPVPPGIIFQALCMPKLTIQS